MPNQQPNYAAQDKLEDRLKSGYYNPATHISYSKECRKEYHQKGAELHEEFKSDLFESYGVVDNPKASLAFDMAWERGHSDGWYAVNNEFSELVELIRD